MLKPITRQLGALLEVDGLPVTPVKVFSSNTWTWFEETSQDTPLGPGKLGTQTTQQHMKRCIPKINAKHRYIETPFQCV